MASFTITPLTDRTGAEVIGLDFTRPIDTETRATLGRAFADVRQREVDASHQARSPQIRRAAATTRAGSGT